MGADVAISCRGVWKSYRIYHQRANTLKETVLSRRSLYEDFWALKGVDLEVPTGATMGIVGANGSGKSTLLKTMARILTPNRGTLEVNGTTSPLLELGTGFHPELTGKENVYLGGSLLGHSRRDIDARYDEIVAFAGIPNFMDTPVKNYSSGMYARLAFAVAISVDPEILLVDEVLSVGDESFQMRCYERMAQLRADGRTIVLVSHSLATIRTMCANAAWIDDGVVREVGDAVEVVSSYLSEVHSTTAQQQDEGSPSSGHRFGSGEATFTDVALLDGDRCPTATFRTGDPWTVRLAYRTERPLDELSCGIAVFRADNLTYLFGQNTGESELELARSGEDCIEFTIPSLPLLRGHYLITVVLHDQMATHIYDCHDRGYSFSVVDNPSLPVGGGMLYVGGTWKAAEPPPLRLQDSDGSPTMIR